MTCDLNRSRCNAPLPPPSSLLLLPPPTCIQTIDIGGCDKEVPSTSSSSHRSVRAYKASTSLPLMNEISTPPINFKPVASAAPDAIAQSEWSSVSSTALANLHAHVVRTRRGGRG